MHAKKSPPMSAAQHALVGPLPVGMESGRARLLPSRRAPLSRSFALPANKSLRDVSRDPARRFRSAKISAYKCSPHSVFLFFNDFLRFFLKWIARPDTVHAYP